jgi:hypothetical protein
MHQIPTRHLSTVLAVALCAAGRAEAFAVAPATPLSTSTGAGLPQELAALLWIPLLLTVAALGLALIWALRARRAPRLLPKQPSATAPRDLSTTAPVSPQRSKSARPRGIATAGLA